MGTALTNGERGEGVSEITLTITKTCSKCKQEFVPQKGRGRTRCAECRLLTVRRDFENTRGRYQNRFRQLMLKVKKAEYEIAMLQVRLDERDKLHDLIMEIKGQ